MFVHEFAWPIHFVCVVESGASIPMRPWASDACSPAHERQQREPLRSKVRQSMHQRRHWRNWRKLMAKWRTRTRRDVVWSMGVSWRRRSVMWSWVIAFMLRLVSGGSSNTGAPSIFRFCMSSHVDQYIVIIVILDTNWSAWNFDQNTWYEICPGYMDLNEICCLFLWLRTWLIILLVRLIWWALPTIIPAVKLPRRLWFDTSRPMRIQARK